MVFGLSGIFPFVFFSLLLRLTLFTSSGVFVIFSLLFFSFQLVLFQVLATSPAGGGVRLIVSSSFFFHFFSFFISICLLCFCFLFDCFLPLLFSHRIRMSCLSYLL